MTITESELDSALARSAARIKAFRAEATKDLTLPITGVDTPGATLGMTPSQRAAAGPASVWRSTAPAGPSDFYRAGADYYPGGGAPSVPTSRVGRSDPEERVWAISGYRGAVRTQMLADTGGRFESDEAEAAWAMKSFRRGRTEMAEAESATAPAAMMGGYVQRMATRLAVLFAAREAFRVTGAGITEQHDLALAGADSRLQLQAIQKWNQSASILGTVGMTAAENVQGFVSGKNVSITGTDLMLQSADIAEKRIQLIQQNAILRRQQQNELAGFSTPEPYERERIAVRGQAAIERFQIEERRREAGELDAQAISNKREQYKEELRETINRNYGPLSRLLIPNEFAEQYAVAKMGSESAQLASVRNADAQKAIGLSQSLEIARLHEIDRQEANRDQITNLRLEGRARELKDDIAHPRNPIFGQIDAMLTSGEEEITGLLQAKKPLEMVQKSRQNLLLSLAAAKKRYATSFQGGSLGWGEIGKLLSENTAEDPAEVFKKFNQAERQAANFNPAVNQGKPLKLDPETLKQLSRDMAEALAGLIAN